LQNSCKWPKRPHSNFPDLSRHCPGLLHGCCTRAERLRRSIAPLRRGRCSCLAGPFGTSVVHVPNVHDGACLSTPTTCGDEGPRRMIRLRASPPFLTHRLSAKSHTDFGEQPFHALRCITSGGCRRLGPVASCTTRSRRTVRRPVGPEEGRRDGHVRVGARRVKWGLVLGEGGLSAGGSRP
jgi:hypothetical protein